MYFRCIRSTAVYTDGITVWNRYHQEMPNGTGLHGDPSSSQWALSYLLRGKRIFIMCFISLISSEFGFEYSLVDMSSNNGMGDVKKPPHP